MAAGVELKLESWPWGSPGSPAPRRLSRCRRTRVQWQLAHPAQAVGGKMLDCKADRRNPFFAEPALWSSSSDIVHPVKVDESGSFLSYDLSHRALHRRSLSSKNKFLAFYELHYKGQPLKFNLSLNINLLTPGFVSERRYGGIADAKIQSHMYNSCHMIGEVRSRTLKGGLAALSTCDGLVNCKFPMDSSSLGTLGTVFTCVCVRIPKEQFPYGLHLLVHKYRIMRNSSASVVDRSLEMMKYLMIMKYHFVIAWFTCSEISFHNK
uniref:Peptidase M12B propeptide domain-containing protein n=1 Tax=Pavo cristatus TaxID=9049 RepID=A0A8C9FUR1_PAVCR